MIHVRDLWFCLIVINVFIKVHSLDNGLALTPPMGWMHWQRFRCITDCEKFPNECISEELFMRTADVMAAEGYADAGYEYIIIDDCWMEKARGEDGRLIADRKRFPSGIKALSDYIHAKGLKFGIYEDYGTYTCAGYPGVIGYMDIDAQTFAEWDVDYVKLDGCYADIEDMDSGYPEFGRLLNATGRPMVYSCSWPVYQEYQGKMPNYEALKEHCNLWRNWGDIDDSWDSVTSITDYFAENQDRIQPHAAPGHWNDPDMLILGNFGLSYDQSKAQMAIWAILAAPLLMSADMATISPDIKGILQNKDVIAVNQDPLGIQGIRVSKEKNIEIWTRPITPVYDGNHSYAVAFVSRRTDGAPYSISSIVSEMGLKNKNGYTVTDLFDKTVQARVVEPSHSFNVRVNPSGVKFFKFTAKP
ncbi:unnamed protein product [Hermetia illucens]|uniref:Alpha-galactosidase n=1 Tax=Hermetia illucens TaxID=343691 RepID=A0A7R8YZU4_HERIL|nr:alpha-N-acetylgalactosaminidase [Hermetia illucens]CAD7091944.1 unnamed protein product [Hermetia illucens]